MFAPLTTYTKTHLEEQVSNRSSTPSILHDTPVSYTTTLPAMIASKNSLQQSRESPLAFAHLGSYYAAISRCRRIWVTWGGRQMAIL